MSLVLFVIMASLALLFLLIVCIMSTIGASDAAESANFKTDQKMRDAQQYLIISSALSWASLATMAIMLFIGLFTGAYSNPKYLASNPPTAQDQANMLKVAAALQASHGIKIVFLVIFIVVTVIIFIVATLLLIALLLVVDVKNKDSRGNGAYIDTMISFIFAALTIIFMIVAIFGYAAMRTNHLNQIDQIQTTVKVNSMVNANNATTNVPNTTN